jgi:hypothetical protein
MASKSAHVASLPASLGLLHHPRLLTWQELGPYMGISYSIVVKSYK